MRHECVNFKMLYNIVQLLLSLGLLSTALVWLYLGSEFPIGGVWVHLCSPLCYLLKLVSTWYANLCSASLGETCKVLGTLPVPTFENSIKTFLAVDTKRTLCILIYNFAPISVLISVFLLREHLKKNCFLSGIEGGGGPCPNFFGAFLPCIGP